jgi:D-3-phosphoglycerate dehydrogenase
MGSGISLDVLMKEVQDCDAILARTVLLSAEVLKVGKRLKVISRHGVGVDNIDLKTATELGIYVTIAPEANANSVAEQTIGLIIAAAKNFYKCGDELRKGNFEIRDRLPGVDLEKKILGIIGLGRIGRIVARKAAFGLDMKIIAHDPFIDRISFSPEIEQIDSWEDVFRKGDFITLHLPLTPDTRGIVGRKEFEIMKPTAYIINTARGDIIRESELIEALREKRIAGAGLDVFEQEPPSRDNPLFQLDNVMLTPHNSTLTKECKVRLAVHAAMGIDEVLSGKKPTWPVNYPLQRKEII